MKWSDIVRKDIEYGVFINSLSHRKSRLVSMVVNEGLTGDYDIGRVESASATIKLVNPRTTIREDAEVRIWYYNEDSTMGQFAHMYVDSFTNDNGVYTLNCYDRLRGADKIYNSRRGGSTRRYLEGIRSSLEIGGGSMLKHYRVHEEYPDSTTMREILGDIAAANGFSFILDRHDNLVNLGRKDKVVGGKANFIYSDQLISYKRYGKDKLPDKIILNPGRGRLEKRYGARGKGRAATYSIDYASWWMARNMGMNMLGGEVYYEACDVECRGNLDYQIGDTFFVHLDTNSDGSYVWLNGMITSMTTRFEGGIQQTLRCSKLVSYPEDNRSVGEVGTMVAINTNREVKRNMETTKKVNEVLEVSSDTTVIKHTNAPYYRYGEYDAEKGEYISNTVYQMIDGVAVTSVMTGGKIINSSTDPENEGEYSVEYEKESGMEVNTEGIYHTKKFLDEIVDGLPREEKVRIPKTYIFEENPDDEIGDVGDVWIQLPNEEEK